MSIIISKNSVVLADNPIKEVVDMSLQFYEAASHINEILIQNQFSLKTLDEHRRCVESLSAYLDMNKSEFSEESMIPWLEEIKQSLSKDAFNRHRRAAYRILRFVTTGSIAYGEGTFGFHGYQYYDSGRPYISLNAYYKGLYQEYMADGEKRLSPSTMYHYRIPVSEFLSMLETDGIAKISDLSISHIAKIKAYFEKKDISEDKKSKSKSAISDFIRSVSSENIPWCYGYYMKVIDNASDIPVVDAGELDGFERADKPSIAIESVFDAFTEEMDKRRYSMGFTCTRRWIFTHFFLFLEINRLAFTLKSAKLWLSKIASLTLFQGKAQFIRWFYEFFAYGTIGEQDDFADATPMEQLPEWSRSILESCLSVKKREGLEPSTLCLYQSSGVRLFSFLKDSGVTCCSEITPEVLIDFHKQDEHRTIEGKNATSAKIRKILAFMAEEGLIPYSHILAITGAYAPVVKIPEILTDEMIQAVYGYRRGISRPIEYRHAAMIMLGLLMGFRSCDVVNLKFKDIDWKEQKISLTQKKTGVPIALPMPTEVANSLYLYITNGRPDPAAKAEGLVFLKNNAPYDGVSRKAAGSALKTALKAQGLCLKKMQGFHILRRTFATRLMRASVGTDGIADALGHASRASVSKYLSMDEDGMRKCPLPFMQIGGANEKT